ncbi:MAG: hypothetical protein GY867_05730 [bacterium]|nr:hypothetical protein [bacterium]
MATGRADKIHPYVLTAFTLTVAAFYAASFFPQARLWGINWFGFFDWYGPISLLAVALLLPLVLVRLGSADDKPSSSRVYGVFASATVLLLTLFLHLFRARTHFLGDGYQILDWLRSGAPNNKPWAAGVHAVLLWLYTAVADFSSQPELAASQLLSYLSGVVFVIAAALSAAWFFERTRDRIIFLLGLCSGGHMLMYFGYVESYPLFVTVVALFSLVGLAVSRGKLGRSWLLIPLGLAVTLHIFCVALIPAGLYLLLRDTSLGRRLASMRPAVRWGGAVLCFAGAVAVFAYAYTHSYFFRFTIVPFVDGPLVVERYTMFSSAHLLDFVNLIWQHAPALLLFGAVRLMLPMRSMVVRPDYRFLFLLAAPSLVMVFIFQPGLATPRDWDLFSFPAVPLVLLGFYAILDNRDRLVGYTTISGLAIALGFMLLIPRVATQVVPEKGLAVFERMAVLDPIRNRSGRFIQIDYYESLGDTANVERVREFCRAKYPQERWYEESRILLEGNRPEAAAEKLRDVVNFDPSHGHAWAGLGLYHYENRRFDSALACWQIATALTPFDADHLRQLGLGYSAVGDTSRAEDCWRGSAHLDDSDPAAQIYLLGLYREQERNDEYERILNTLGARPDVPLGVLVEYADYCAFVGDLAASVEGYSRALAQGLDSAFVRERQRQYPGLRVIED